MVADHLMFLPLSTSQSVGAPFSSLTILRVGLPPHMVQSAPRETRGGSAKPQAATRAEVQRALVVFMGEPRCRSSSSFLFRFRVLGTVVGDHHVVVVDDARERADER